MFRKFGLLTVLVLIAAAMTSHRFSDPGSDPKKVWNEDTPVADVLKEMGVPYPDNRPQDMGETMVKRGYELVHNGVTTGPDGKKTRLQSKYFVCTNCHNMEKEDPDLRFSDPETRLDYAKANGQAFLQGTTMYGTVNKSSWYNGDYERKYGDLVKPARNSLEEAIQLCSVVCSQGRALEDWEMTAILAYFWSIQLKMGDLMLSQEDWAKLNAARKEAGDKREIASWLQGYYRSGSPATFVEVPEDKGSGYEGVNGNAENGKRVYDMACMSCHGVDGPSNYLKLGNDNLSLSMLRRHVKSGGFLGLYQIVRHGTHADAGHRAYMPNFTAERMSNQQLEDLRAYIEQGE